MQAVIETAEREQDLAERGRFGVLLRRYRTAAELTQVQLAERSGYYVNYVRKLERGERRPSRQVTLALMRALDLSAEDRVPFERAAHNGLAAEPPLVGRQSELAVLERAFISDARRLIMVGGEPSIGKSRLLSAARDLAVERGLLTLGSACRTGDTFPFAPLRAALELPLWSREAGERIRLLAGCERLSELIAQSIGVTLRISSALVGEQDCRLVSDAITRFLTRLACEQRIVLLLDDLHRADAGTINVLGQLLHRSTLPLCVVATCLEPLPDAGESLHALMDAAVQEEIGEGLPLGPLTAPQAATLLRDLVGDAVGEDEQARLVRDSRGVPGRLVEMARGSWDGREAEPIDIQRAGHVTTGASDGSSGWSGGVTLMAAQDWCAG